MVMIAPVFFLMCTEDFFQSHYFQFPDDDFLQSHRSLNAMSHICLATVETETAPNPDASIIWLHGLGADGHDFEPVVPELDLPQGLAVRFIFPHAPSMPVSINGGYIMPAWYDIRQTDLGIEQDEEGIQRSAGAIKLLIEQEQMRGVEQSRIIVAGFSQGGAMALHVGLQSEAGVGGIVALSAYLLRTAMRACSEGAMHRPETPIFMAHGIDDPVVPCALADSGYRYLLKRGYPVEWHSHPIQHTVCPDEIRALGRWLSGLLIP